jgi:hypothetical protein
MGYSVKWLTLNGFGCRTRCSDCGCRATLGQNSTCKPVIPTMFSVVSINLSRQILQFTGKIISSHNTAEVIYHAV